MKVRKSIMIESEIDKEIAKMVDMEFQREIKKLKSIKEKEIRQIQKKVNYSEMVNRLLKKGIRARAHGL